MITKEKIEELYDKSFIKYRYSDVDGDNNIGIRFDKDTFIELCLDEINKKWKEY